MRNPDAISILEACYRLELNEQEWLDGLADVASCAIGGGFGASCYINDYKRERARGSSGGSATEEQAFRAVEQEIPEDVRQRLVRFVGCLTGFEVGQKFLGLGDEAVRQVLDANLTHWGPTDALILQGADPFGPTLTIAVPREQQVILSPGERNSWNRVSVHLSTALRMREALGAADVLEQAAAVFSPSGHCEHLSVACESANVRDTLRAGVRAMHAARTTDRAEPDCGALKLWTGLVEGSWSLVDHFDTDGRRFVVAVENEVAVAADRALTRRERQAVELVSLGHSDALAGYALGLSATAIRTHVDRAMIKLGVQNRMDLIRLRKTTSADQSESRAGASADG